MPPTTRKARPIVVRKSGTTLTVPAPPRLSSDDRAKDRRAYDDTVQRRTEEDAKEKCRKEEEEKIRVEEEEKRKRRLSVDEGGFCFRATPTPTFKTKARTVDENDDEQEG